MDVQTTLREFIQQNFLARKGGHDLSNDESLLETGLVDSAGIFELVGFIERTFNVEIDDADIVPENFESVNTLSAYVTSKLGTRTS
jgi:acyl carrier protein